ncbi:MAG: DUF1080 domain-containing protein [Lentisphaerae bacterium]|nr:DUF1080 domain-containing protein [Lentisphaerota bacterium]MBT4819350.1 DUF1080 domain-containing protein [Lentisphaerota bacterium]MBT5606764.1 DUF1080 domain-containing protein [Lentisphaerota bacterium]MBT7061560.1 DUF1080 domain-containing protein [Lentisphaerota bacterium]MBT7843889.1 DUF1080 domain-containing protein [Lentisphaerota bacterium]
MSVHSVLTLDKRGMRTVAEQAKPGYSDTPLIPNSKYRVHDCDRPQPRVVTPGTESTQEAAGAAPSDAVVLFDGTDLSGWVDKDGNEAKWKVENGYMEVAPKAGNIKSVAEFGDCQLHVEWASPVVVEGDSQGRGNSGVFLMGKYEIQVLDCFENPTYPDGTTGGIYGQCPPLANSCRKPGEWQVYDIIWIAPRFEDGKVVSPARVTVFLNGVLLHHDKELIGATTHKKVGEYVPHASAGPLELQDHKNPVRFRNIWYRPLGAYDQE